MARTYAQITSLVLQMLQDATIYDSTETGYWIEESLKELAQYDPHILMLTFKIEARTGTATSGTTTNTLEDSTNDHFVAADANNEKVVYNTKDKTWAVITSRTDSENIGLSADIMVSGEGYKIYNKHCDNNKQIYIGDVGDYLWIDRVEYRCSRWPRSWRNWKLYGGVLEIDIDFTPTDEDEVNVYFAKPHQLCQLTDLSGKVHTSANPTGQTMLVKHFEEDAKVEIGDEFTIDNHRTTYTILTAVTLTNQSTTGGILHFYPGLEATATADWDINFIKSTLKPQHEEIFCHLVAARAVLSDYIRHINEIPKGGDRVIGDYRQWAFDKLAEVREKMEGLTSPETKRGYPTT